MVRNSSADSRASNSNKYLSGISVWALSYGCIVGWGSFILPGTTMLPDAGPLGTLLGTIFASFVAFIVCFNYSWMMQKFPETGGSFMFTSKILGSDHGFLAVWALMLAYLAVFWANSTAFVLIGRFVIGDVFQWGIHYVVAGYDVYLGEVLASVTMQVLFALVTAFFKRLADVLRSIFSIVLFAVVVLIFIKVALTFGFSTMFSPRFSGSKPVTVQVLNIAALAPWMFVGFETVTHTVGDTKFKPQKIFSYAGIAILCGMITYILLTLTASSSVPEGYTGWPDYTADLDNLSGITSIPVFYNVNKAFGRLGKPVLFVAMLSALSSSVLGSYRAAARVIKSMADEHLLPKKLGELDKDGIPVNAVFFIFVISLPIPFLGRTVLGWTADIATLTVSMVYAYISLCTAKTANGRGHIKFKVTGILGMTSAILVFFSLLLPNVFAVDSLAKEAYFILVAWSLAGILYYWFVFSHDREFKYGRSTIMWLMMLFLLFFATNIWVRLQSQDSITKIIHEGGDIVSVLSQGSLVQMLVIMSALLVLQRLFVTLLRREKELDFKVLQSEAKNKAKSDFLSNMSHDIRTPINAILGMDEMILRESSEKPILRYAANIKTAGANLLGIVNEILDFSRVEAGKISIMPEQYESSSMIVDLMIIASVAAKEKGLKFMLKNDESLPRGLYGDEARIKQCALNLLTNAVKYTKDGSVEFTISHEKISDTKILLGISVRDTGIGIKAEDIDKLSQPFERLEEKRNKKIEGTGLGVSIVTRVLALMGSRLEVQSEYGKGSVFSFKVEQEVRDWTAVGDINRAFQESERESSIYQGRLYAPKAKLLFVDDTEMNLEVIQGLLKTTGMRIDTATSGKAALEMARNEAYDILFIDHRMPEMDGIETMAELLRMEGNKSAGKPCIALTANAISGARQVYMDAGFSDYLSKPVSPERLEQMIRNYLPAGYIEERGGPAEGDAGVLGLEGGSSEDDALVDALRGVAGLDVDAGLRNCGGAELLAATIRNYAAFWKERRGELDGYLAAGDWDNYGIKVHSLKSVSRLIGAVGLSEGAARLEDAADRGDAEEIQENHGTLMADYEALYGKLAPLAEAGAEEKQAMPEEEFSEKLAALKKCAEAYDLNGLDALMADLAKAELPAGREELFSKISRCAENVDFLGLKKILEEEDS